MKLSKIFTGFFCCWISLFLSAHTEAASGNPSPENEPLVLESVSIIANSIVDNQGNVLGATIPLKRAGRLFVMEGTVNGVTGNFILDTGASGLVLNKTYFRNSIVVEDEEGGGVTGSTGAIERIHVKKMTVSELVYTNLAADVTPLGHLENRRGVKILGLFGMNLLQQTEMVIDLRNNELQIINIDRNGNRPGKTSPDVKFDVVRKLQMYRNIVFVKAEIGGKQLDFCLDTGAESNLLHSGASKQVMNTVTITRRSTLRGAGTDQGEILLGTLNEFKFGLKELGPMEAAVCSLTAMSGKYGFVIDGMLGYDFFMKGKFFLNLVKKEMGICLYAEGKP